MATEEYDAGQKLEKLQENLAKVETLSERLIAALSRHRNHDPALNAPSNELFMKAAQAYLAAMMQNPARVLEHQVGYWTKSLKHYIEAQQALAKGESLSRSAVTHILDLCDTAYDSGKIDIGHYSFSHLAFAIFCRPEPYLGIRLRDFTVDSENNNYYVEVARVKSREHNPGKIRYCINEHLGVLLKKQRQHVIATVWSPRGK